MPVIDSSNITATAHNSLDTDHDSNNACNESGISGSLHDGVVGNSWYTGNLGQTVDKKWIKFDLGQLYDLTQIEIWNYKESPVDRGVKRCDIWVIDVDTNNNSNEDQLTFDTTGWTLIHDNITLTKSTTPPSGVDNTLSNSSVQCRYVAIRVKANFKGLGKNEVGLSEVKFTGTAVAAADYTLTVSSGSGDGDYVAGTVVNISADAPPSGEVFDAWTGNTTGITDINASSTTITTQSSNATITATYTPILYTLTVTDGTGDGDYSANTSVSIVADASAPGFSFTSWTGDTAGIVDINSASTTITTQAAPATISANYAQDIFTLTVTGGSGDGNYTFNQGVSIVADAAPAGQQFDAWTGDVATVSDVSASSTTMTMPLSNASVTATYGVIQYAVTVNNGTGDGDYALGSAVTITADPPPVGQIFSVWTGDADFLGSMNINVSPAVASMPAHSAIVTANYVDVDYTLTVTGGSGGGTYNYQSIVPVVAAAPATGQQFDAWIGDTALLTDVNAASTTLTMGAANASITATYIAIDYIATIVSGTGSGTYNYNDIVAISADTIFHKTFAEWTGDSQFLADDLSASTTLTMPNQPVNITATYNDILYALTVTNGTGGGNYAIGSIVSIAADAPTAGQQFSVWSGDTAGIANTASASTTITTQGAAANITATYSAIGFDLVVNAGTGDGNYTSGTVVSIVADAAPAGQQFDAWTGDTAGIAGINSASTTITMPASSATITATYAALPTSILVVNNGTGDGTFVEGTTQPIVADAAGIGQVFDQWSGQTAGIVNINDASTSIVIQVANATITANYIDIDYTVTISDGSGGGTYNYLDTVNIAADSAPDNFQFSQWSSSDIDVINDMDDYQSSSTSFVMSDFDVDLSANYTDILYPVTVTNGSASGSFIIGTFVTLTADPALSGMTFDEWIGDVDLISTIDDINDASTFAIVPGHDSSISATYKSTNQQYSVLVFNGTGSGQYAEGKTVHVIGHEPNPGYLFSDWQGDNSYLESTDSIETIFVMPGHPVSITANYEKIDYVVVVTGGLGSGVYQVGDVFNILAHESQVNRNFKQWIGDTAGVDNLTAASTFITMPARDINIYAVNDGGPIEDCSDPYCQFCAMVRNNCASDSNLAVYCESCACIVDVTDVFVSDVGSKSNDCGHDNPDDHKLDCDRCAITCGWLESAPYSLTRLRGMANAFIQPFADIISMACSGSIDICELGEIFGFPCTHCFAYETSEDYVELDLGSICDELQTGYHQLSPIINTTSRYTFNIDTQDGLDNYKQHFQCYVQSLQSATSGNLRVCLSILYPDSQPIIWGSIGHYIVVDIGRKMTYFEQALIPLARNIMPTPVGFELIFIEQV